MTAIAIDTAEASRRLAELPGWHIRTDGKALERSFVFKNLSKAFGFMTRTAPVAERLNHHLEWFNVHKRVDVQLTVHDTGGLTEPDCQLAKAMNRIAEGA